MPYLRSLAVAHNNHTKHRLQENAPYCRTTRAERAPVAGVESAGALAVLGPGALAEPAELEAALATGHVHAALVLLDGPLALGALLGVRKDPI